MSGDVQPRKRGKDKRRRRDDEDSGTPPPTLIRSSSDESDSVTTIHVYKDVTTGGHWCVRIVFFILMAALLGVIGLIIIEKRGETDVDTPIASSQWAPLLDGWVDDNANQDDHGVAHESEEGHHDGDDDEDGAEDHHDVEDESEHDDEENHSQEDEDDDKSSNDTQSDEAGENDSENDEGFEEPPDQLDDQECEDFTEQSPDETLSEEEWSEKIQHLEEEAKSLGINLDDDDDDDDDETPVDEAENSQNDSKENDEGFDEQSQNENENSSREIDSKVQGTKSHFQSRRILTITKGIYGSDHDDDDDDDDDDEIDDDFSLPSNENDLDALEEVDDQSEELNPLSEETILDPYGASEELEIVEGIAVPDHLYINRENSDSDEYVIIPGIDEMDDRSDEPLEEIESDEPEELPNEVEEDEEDMEIEEVEEPASVTMKFIIGMALLITAHFVLVRRWKNKNKDAIQLLDPDDLLELSRRNTLVMPMRVEELSKNLDNAITQEYKESSKDLESKYRTSSNKRTGIEEIFAKKTSDLEMILRGDIPDKKSKANLQKIKQNQKDYSESEYDDESDPEVEQESGEEIENVRKNKIGNENSGKISSRNYSLESEEEEAADEEEYSEDESMEEEGEEDEEDGEGDEEEEEEEEEEEILDNQSKNAKKRAQ